MLCYVTDRQDFLDGCELFFAVFYTAELLFKIVAFKRLFLKGKDWKWNMFDTWIWYVGFDLLSPAAHRYCS